MYRVNVGARVMYITCARIMRARARYTTFHPRTTAGTSAKRGVLCLEVHPVGAPSWAGFGAFKSDEGDLNDMPLIPVTSKLSQSEIQFLDSMVSRGEAKSRSDAIRKVVSDACPGKRQSNGGIRTVSLDMSRARLLSQQGVHGSSDGRRAQRQNRAPGRDSAGIHRF